MEYPKFTLFFVLLVLSTGRVTGETYDDIIRLRTAILSGYRTDIRPVFDQSAVVSVNISAVLYNIQEVDVVRGSLTVLLQLICTWHDEKLSWDPSDYNNTKAIKLLQDDVWTPQLVLGTPIESIQMGYSWMCIDYSSNGLALWKPGNVMIVACKFNVQFWPFDKQVCDISFLSLDYQSDKLDVNIGRARFNTHFFKGNGEWSIEGSEAFVIDHNQYKEAVFRIKLRRQSALYIFLIILPLLGIEALSPLVFLLPQETGDRLSYSTTILLSSTVFMLVVGDNIPKTSDPLPLLVVLLGVALSMSLGTIVIVVFNLEIYNKDESEQEKPRFYLTLVRLTLSKEWMMKRNKIESKSNKDDSLSVLNNDLYGEPDVMSMEKQQTKFHKGISPNGSTEGSTVTWKTVSYAIDRLSFIVMIFLHLIVFSSFIVYLITASSYEQK